MCLAVLTRRCPQCGRESAFETWFRMKPACGACGRTFQRPSGSTTGTMQIGSMALVLFAIAAWVVLYHGFGLSRDPALIAMGVGSLLFGLAFHPYAKLIWEAVDSLVDAMNRDESGQ